MSKRIVLAAIIVIIGASLLLVLLFFRSNKKEVEKVSRVIDAMSQGDSHAADIRRADYLIANKTEHVIEVRKVTYQKDGGTRLDSNRIDPDKMIQIYTTNVDTNEDTSPSNIFSDLKIFSSKRSWSEDVVYFGVNNGDWKSFPSFDPSRRRYVLFIGPDTKVISPKDCSKEYDDFGFRFTYPCTWEVRAESSEKSIWVSSPRQWFFARFPAPTFEEYEDEMRKNFRGQFVVKEKQITIGGVAYPGKEFSHHGGIEYIFEIGGNYVGVWAESYITDETNEALKMIFGSLEF